MDVSIIPTIASAIVTLLVPYLKNFGKNMLKKAAEDLNSKAGELVQAKVNQIYGLCNHFSVKSASIH